METLLKGRPYQAILVFVLLLPCLPCYAGKIDLNDEVPNPAVAVANGLFIPGGGWFYLAQLPSSKAQSDKDATKAVMFLAGSLASIAVLVNGINQDQRLYAWLGAGSLFCIRWADLTGAAEAASYRERKALKDR